MIWHRAGVPKDWTSGYETFEGLDPAEWTRRGYAIVNVDVRGAQFSEGTYFFWGDQEAEDIYDTFDYFSKRPWCNGSVCMAGNSYLVKAQVSFASRQSHPALKALAPLEEFIVPGKGMAFSVAGHFLDAPATPAIQLEKLDNENLGHHQVHTGGKHDPCLTLPVIAGIRT